MISISQARATILAQVQPNGPVRIGIQHAVGRVLAENIAYDLDSPPYDKALMDGFAVRSIDRRQGRTSLEVIDRITAGMTPHVALREGTAIEIMTGAPVPAGADAVVMIEQTTRHEKAGTQFIEINASSIAPGQNILRRGASAQQGEIVFARGHCLRPRDIGVLCEAGRDAVRIVRPARVTVLATGNELVPANTVPTHAQIRNTNGPMLAAMARQFGAQCRYGGICRDDPAQLELAIKNNLDTDILLLSGGVSTGVLDLVPNALAQLGVECLFHKVYLKPGKPLWFGRYQQNDRTTCVFGLPGNPIGSLVCFQLFVRPTIQRLGGAEPSALTTIQAVLGCAYHQQWDRPTYYPVKIERFAAGRAVVAPLSWQGSADQRTVARADGLALFHADRQHYPAGSAVEVLLMEDTNL